MKTSRLYIPIHSKDLPVYFSAGLIMPFNFFKKSQEVKLEPFANSLLFSEYKWVEQFNCSIEIVLTNEEKMKLLPIDDGIFILNSCLPITRIKKIFFKEKEQADITIWNTNNATAFIPQRLVDSGADDIDKPTELKLKDVSIPSYDVIDLKDNINRFNVILGGFSFSKVAAAFQKLTYPKNYFATLGHFNSKIADEVSVAEKDLEFDFDRKNIGLFSNKFQSEWSPYLKLIYSDVNNETVRNLARELGIDIRTSLGIIKPDDSLKNSILYDFILLATYGSTRSKSLEDLISYLKKANLSSTKLEEITLLFGLHIGYSGLRNAYQVDGKKVNVKFGLENRLDYHIIESIFQFTFNGKRDVYETEFLEELFRDIYQLEVDNIQNPQYVICGEKIEVVNELEIDFQFLHQFEQTLSGDLTEDFINANNHPLVLLDRGKILSYFQEIVKNRTKALETKIWEITKDISNRNVVKKEAVAKDFERAKQGAQSELIKNEELSHLASSELKKLAKKLNIPVKKSFKGSMHEIQELINKINNVPTIL